MNAFIRDSRNQSQSFRLKDTVRDPAVCELVRVPLGHLICCHLTLDFAAFRTVRNMFLLFKPPIYGIVAIGGKD